MSSLQVSIIPLLRDNYTFFITTPSNSPAILIDPAHVSVLDWLREKKIQLDFIWNTHHHPDHAGSNLEIKKATGCQILGSTYDAHRIEGIDHHLKDGDVLRLGEHPAKVMHVPGHTKGHIAFWFYEDKCLFVGDHLFNLGCGRLFEGSPREMWGSMLRIKSLPRDTTVYCAHEYSEKNATFALRVEPNNVRLHDISKNISERRQKNLPTIPFQLSDQLDANPFLRVDLEEVANLKIFEGCQSHAERFRVLREWKDRN